MYLCDPQLLNADVHPSANLGKEGYLVFTFDDEKIANRSIYTDYFPVIWRLVFGVGIENAFAAYLRFRVAHLTATGKWYCVVSLGSLLTIAAGIHRFSETFNQK